MFIGVAMLELRGRLAGIVTLGVLLLGAAPASAAPDATPGAAAPQLLSRPGSGTLNVTGLAAVIASGQLPHWPLQLDPNVRCDPAGCAPWTQLEVTLNRAAQWMAAFPVDGLHFDAAVGLSMIRQTLDSPALRLAFDRARAVADRDADHPQRRFWTLDFHAPAQQTSTWTAPADGSRVNPNRVIEEALHCAANGWRRETMQYVCGPMRDGGGYQSIHALWALDIASHNGCVQNTDFPSCVSALQEEVRRSQPAELHPQATLDIDLFAERLLVLVLTGDPTAAVNDWAKALIALQSPDGSWGVAVHDEPPYFRYHATNAATWALAEWFRRVVGHPESRPQAQR
jgi:hypothetical protein